MSCTRYEWSMRFVYSLVVDVETGRRGFCQKKKFTKNCTKKRGHSWEEHRDEIKGKLFLVKKKQVTSRKKKSKRGRKWITYCDLRASASPCRNSCVPWFVTRLVDQAWLWRGDLDTFTFWASMGLVEVGINCMWVVKRGLFTWYDCAFEGGDKWDTEKDEVVDKAEGRLWVTKSDLLSKKKVCGVIRGWIPGGIWRFNCCWDCDDDEGTRTSGKGSTQSATSAFLTLVS